MTWPSTLTGLSARPQSCAAHILLTVTTPVSSSTVTSATCAEYEYAGDGPTPPPLCPPPRACGGGAYDPVPLSAPVKSIAATTASSKLKRSFGPSSLRFCWSEPRSTCPSTRPETCATLPAAAGPPYGLSFLSRMCAASGIGDDETCAAPRRQTTSSRITTSSSAQAIFFAAACTIFFFTS